MALSTPQRKKKPKNRREADAENRGDKVIHKDSHIPATPEVGGQKGPEPTRFGDWEKDGRCTDF